MNALMLSFKANRKRKTYFDDPPVPPPEIKFTPEQQAYVNKLLNENKATVKAQNENLIRELETLKSNVNLTKTEKEALDARIVQLQSEHLTEAQRAAAAVETWKKKYDTDTEGLKQTASAAQTRFEKLLVTNAITAASLDHKVRSANQMTLILLPQAKVMPVLGDDGQPTGEYVAKVPMTVPDTKNKGKSVTLELPIGEAIERMKTMDDYANLFVQEGRGGIGGLSGAGAGGRSGNVDWSKLTPEEHRKARAENK